MAVILFTGVTYLYTDGKVYSWIYCGGVMQGKS